jgi:hypothetical protein
VKPLYLAIFIVFFLVIGQTGCSSGPDSTPTAALVSSPTLAHTLTALPSTTAPIITPSPAPTQSLFPTPSRTSTLPSVPPTATSTATITPNPGWIAAVIGLVDDYIQGNTILILGENLNVINKFPRSDLSLTGFSQDGCHLRSIRYSDGSFIIHELDFYGVETQKITALSKKAEDDTKIYQFNLSPSGRWLAYKVVDQYGMSQEGAKIQDVKLLQVNEQTPQDVLHLTERGGARPARSTWSWDNHFLAYTDFDEAGVIQIYL